MWQIQCRSLLPKTLSYKGDDENIWSAALDTFEEGHDDGQSSSVGDDNDHGDLIGAIHT